MGHEGGALAVLALVLVVSACGGREGESVGSATSDEWAPAAAPSASGTDETAREATATYEVWFAANEGFLFVAKRPVKPGRTLGRAALGSLLAGPSQAEASAGASLSTTTKPPPSPIEAVNLWADSRPVSFEDFDKYCEERDVKPGDYGAAFA